MGKVVALGDTTIIISDQVKTNKLAEQAVNNIFHLIPTN
jgi:hypothetical protein